MNNLCIVNIYNFVQILVIPTTEIMMFPISKDDVVAFFNLINELHQHTSLIITRNKAPKEWAGVLQDKVLTTALLDRILDRCEIIKLQGNSYRIRQRKTIF